MGWLSVGLDLFGRLIYGGNLVLVKRAFPRVNAVDVRQDFWTRFCSAIRACEEAGWRPQEYPGIS